MAKLLLQPELTGVLTIYATKYTPQSLEAYVQAVQAGGDYKDLEVRIANDVLRAAVGTSVLCSWYDKYGCNDKHITALAKAALRTLYTIN